MADDFVRQLVTILDSTPRTSWEVRLRMELGGEWRYLRRRDPSVAERVRSLAASGVPERTARKMVTGK